MDRSDTRAWGRLGAGIAATALAVAAVLMAAPSAGADDRHCEPAAPKVADRAHTMGGKGHHHGCEQPGEPVEPGDPEPTEPPDPEGPGGLCFGRAITIAGTPAADVLVGTFGKDVIASFGGNDVVRGDADFGGFPGGDEDAICLGEGDDVADGAANSDMISGGIGNDVLDGDNFPSPFPDTLFGGEGNDTFTGGMGDDTIVGGPGNDIVDPPGSGVGSPPSAGADVIFGGTGDDLVTEQADGGTDTIDAGPGNDRCTVDVTDVVENCETVIRVP